MFQGFTKSVVFFSGSFRKSVELGRDFPCQVQDKGKGDYLKILVLGAGRMGLGACFDLVRSAEVKVVTVADLARLKAEAIVCRLASPKLTATTVNVADFARVVDLMRGYDAVISCVVYRHNLTLARAALEAGVNFCDLGGNNQVVDAELALDEEARAAGIRIIPDCGLAPGLVSILTAHGVKQFDRLGAAHIRVGGLPRYPQPPLNYQIVFSIDGLINEYVEPARILRGGQIVEVESLTEVESLEFPPPYGALEAFHTSGGISTLPESFRGVVQELDYKTIRYPGHCQQFKLLLDLGFASGTPVRVDGGEVVPRNLLRELLCQKIPSEGPDIILVRVEFSGIQKGRECRLFYDIIDHYDGQTGLSAMMRTTAFPASIVAQMMARGDIPDPGAIPQERCVPTDKFIEALAERNIRLVEYSR
jgi:lysine 6-dehydrogenase